MVAKLEADCSIQPYAIGGDGREEKKKELPDNSAMLSLFESYNLFKSSPNPENSRMLANRILNHALQEMSLTKKLAKRAERIKNDLVGAWDEGRIKLALQEAIRVELASMKIVADEHLGKLILKRNIARILKQQREDALPKQERRVRWESEI